VSSDTVIQCQVVRSRMSVVRPVHNSLNDVMCYVTSGKGLTPVVSM